MTASVHDWIIKEGRHHADPGAFIASLCGQLKAQGMDLLRANVQVRTLHPEVGIYLASWFRAGSIIPPAPARDLLNEQVTRTVDGGTVRVVSVAHSAFKGETFLKSPFFRVVEHGEVVRFKVEEPVPYPIVTDLRAANATEYLAFPLTFSSGVRSGISFSTDRPGGFAPGNIEALLELAPLLSFCLELYAQRDITRSLVHTYVGRDAGDAVLAGRVRPGEVRRIQAALWFSDLRGFTTMSQAMSSEALVGTLNAYFAAITSALPRHGGEVLKYIGDASLVVFPVRADRDAERACADAVAAAEEATGALDALNAARTRDGLAPLEHGIGLHFGEAEYGNIGAPGRLDFTVIGPDVNYASRVEGMCGKLERRLLASSALQRRTPQLAWRELGDHALKGITEKQALFGL